MLINSHGLKILMPPLKILVNFVGGEFVTFKILPITLQTKQ